MGTVAEVHGGCDVATSLRAVPPDYPPQQPQAPNLGGLFSQLLGALVVGQGTGNLLLLAIFGFQIYRAYAKTKGIPLLLDDATATHLMQLLQQLRQPTQQPLPIFTLLRCGKLNTLPH